MKKQVKKYTQEQQDAINYLKSIIKPKTQFYINLHSVSSTGMSRKMSAYVIGKVDYYDYKNGESVKKKKNDLIRLNWYLKKAGIVDLDKNGNIIMKGCGIDMLMEVVCRTKQELYGYKAALHNQNYTSI
jgi:hypothetical protein